MSRTQRGPNDRVSPLTPTPPPPPPSLAVDIGEIDVAPQEEIERLLDHPDETPTPSPSEADVTEEPATDE